MEKSLTLTKICSGNFNLRGYTYYLINQNETDTFENKLKYLVSKATDKDENDLLVNTLGEFLKDENNDKGFRIEYYSSKDTYELSSYSKIEKVKLERELIHKRAKEMTEKEYNGVLKLFEALSLLFDDELNVNPTTDEDKEELKRVFLTAINEDQEESENFFMKLCLKLKLYIEIKNFIKNFDIDSNSEKGDKE